MRAIIYLSKLICIRAYIYYRAVIQVYLCLLCSHVPPLALLLSPPSLVFMPAVQGFNILNIFSP